LRTGAELRQVGLAQRNGAGSLLARHHQAAALGHEIGEYGRTMGRPHAGGQETVLVRHGQAMQQPQRLAARLVGRRGAPARAFDIQRDNGVDRGVPMFDGLQMRLQDLARAQMAGRQFGPQLQRGHCANRFPAHGLLRSSIAIQYKVLNIRIYTAAACLCTMRVNK